MTKAKLHHDLIEQTLIALSKPTIDEKLKPYHLIGLWLELHPDADVYERFKACTAMALLKESLGDDVAEIQTKRQSAAQVIRDEAGVEAIHKKAIVVICQQGFTAGAQETAQKADIGLLSVFELIALAKEEVTLSMLTRGSEKMVKYRDIKYF